MKQHVICKRIADEAVAALIEEVQLTPKPGLVDTENNGAHHDLSLTKMQNSAHSLHNTFYQMAMLSFKRQPTVEIREQFGAIGRNGEKEMFAVTENSNTHKGAIWSIGLLCSAIARRQGQVLYPQVFNDAAELANLPDQYIPKSKTNGSKVKENYGIPGAREEAQQAFPHIQKFSLPKIFSSGSKDVAKRCETSYVTSIDCKFKRHLFTSSRRSGRIGVCETGSEETANKLFNFKYEETR